MCQGCDQDLQIKTKYDSIHQDLSAQSYNSDEEIANVCALLWLGSIPKRP